MRPILTRLEARAFDADAIERLQVLGLLLMENAGSAACEVLVRRLGPSLRSPLLVGGTGQNGGDAWVVARHLLVNGFRPQVAVVGDPGQIQGDAATNFAILQRLQIPIEVVDDGHGIQRLHAAIAKASCLVDGLFGTGLDRPISGLHAAVVEAINRSQLPTLALDVPSGVDVDSGAVLGAAVRADCTATFVAPKFGMTQYPARALCGEIEVCSIGVPPPKGTPAMCIDDDDLRAWLARRPADTHKGSAGHVLVFAGDRGTTGAALLSGRAALRSGAGLVTLAPRLRAQAALDAKVTEMMTVALPEHDVEGCLSLCERAKVAVIGPGFGKDPVGRRLIAALVQRLPVPTVVDADALSCVADEGIALLAASVAPRVLTPHPGEAGRLLGVPTSDVQADRRAAVLALAAGSRQVTILKGASTLVAGVEGRVRVCLAGSPAMAVAGMGDVLTGILASALCHLSPLEAACAAVQWHGRAGERMLGDRGLLASELADGLPVTLAQLQSR